MDALKGDFEETDQMFKDLEVEVDGLRQELYKDHTAIIKELPPIDLNEEENRVVDKTAQKLPENKQREGSSQVSTKSSGSRGAEKTQLSRPVILQESASLVFSRILETNMK